MFLLLGQVQFGICVCFLRLQELEGRVLVDSGDTSPAMKDIKLKLDSFRDKLEVMFAIHVLFPADSSSGQFSLV